ncbi:MAG: response regulator transcription factor [Opitutae bacterium]|nr:response regulator transcription factor [Opitutae bacterium]
MNNIRVVLIEDHAMVRELLGEAVASVPRLKLVASAGSKTEGIAACLEHKPRLIISDWMLPDGSGLDVICRCRAKLPDALFIMVTSNEQEAIVRDAVAAGVHGFVMKRLPLATLRTAIETVLDGRTYYCPISSQLLVGSLHNEAVNLAPSLTTREREILRAVASGLIPKEFAARLMLSLKTVANHHTALKQKLHITEPAALVRYAIKHGIVDNP